MADLSTVASLATAGGTLILAVATFASTRSANRAARVAEQSLLAGLRPLLVPSRVQDPVEKVTWSDDHYDRVPGGRSVISEADGAIYLAGALRNVGAGLALLHGWDVWTDMSDPTRDPRDPDEFRRLTRDLYIGANDTGFWQGAIRDADDPLQQPLREIIAEPRRFMVDVMYGDADGGQRTITRFGYTPITDGWLFTVARHWYLDRPAPR